MKPLIFSACLLVFATAAALSALGQGCGVDMVRNYAAYQSFSSDGSNIYTSVLVDGSATCTPTPSCPCGTATHTPKAYNKIASNGGWGTGSPGCVNCYLSYENDQSTPASPGVTYQFNGEAQIICSIAGVFYDQLFSGGLAIHMSAYKFAGVSSGRCAWSPTCTGKCTASGYTTNMDNGKCYSGLNIYRQCYDLTYSGKCVDYRTFCLGQPGDGICN